jgi:hypothetical protein
VPIKHETPPEYPDEERDHWRNTDIEENARSQPPPGETVRRPALMLSECFVGGDVDQLISGLQALGFDPEDTRSGGSGFGPWIEAARRTGSPFGWTVIGTAATELHFTERFIGGIETELPPEYSRITLRVDVPAPAVVVLTAVFTLAESAALGIDDELRTDRFLQVKKVGSITSYATAIHRKRDAVRQERERMREHASTWVAQTFAGTLSAQFGLRALPGIEFLEFELHRPYEDDTEPRSRHRHEDYRSVLGVHSAFDSFESDDWPSWRLGVGSQRSAEAWVLVAGCRRRAQTESSDNAAQTDTHRDPPAPELRGGYGFIEEFGGLSVRYAVLCLLSAYEGELAQVRDELTSTEGTGSRAVSDVLSRAKSTLSELTFDAALVAHGVKRWADDEWQWNYEVPSLVYADAQRREHDPEFQLVADMRGLVHLGADWVLEMEARIRDQTTIISNLEAAATNLLLVRVTLWVSAAAMIIAVLALLKQ